MNLIAIGIIGLIGGLAMLKSKESLQESNKLKPIKIPVINKKKF